MQSIAKERAKGRRVLIGMGRVDYDLVVIGSNREAIYAALNAVYLNARVALVEQHTSHSYREDIEQISTRLFTQMSYLFQENSNTLLVSESEAISTSLNRVEDVKAWVEEVIATTREENSPAILASLGVDVINGGGSFCQQPEQFFLVNKRKLRSRSYLIATGSHLVVPDIQGLKATGYLSIGDLWYKNTLELLPYNLTILGNSLLAIELAQCLVRLNKKVTLVIEDSRILPKEDREASILIQAQLEAEGIRLITQSPVKQVRLIEGKKWVQAGNKGIETDEIIVVGSATPSIEDLNLAGVGVELEGNRIRVNDKLQTTNPRIYACGDVIGGYSFSHIAQYEARIAIKNALFVPVFKVDYRCIPWMSFTEPSLARVGMTEAQARRRYEKDIYVVKQYFKHLFRAQMLDRTTGFCQLIVRGNGEILGAQIVGAGAGELISSIAQLMNNNIKLDRIIDLFFPSLTFSEIIHQTAFEWHKQKLKRNNIWQIWRKIWFNWLRF